MPLQKMHTGKYGFPPATVFPVCLSTKKVDSAWFTNYRYEDGTLKGEYRNQEVQTLPDGRILMGGVDGWTLFHPDSVEIPHKDFSPLLIGLSLYGEPIHITPLIP